MNTPKLLLQKGIQENCSYKQYNDEVTRDTRKLFLQTIQQWRCQGYTKTAPTNNITIRLPWIRQNCSYKQYNNEITRDTPKLIIRTIWLNIYHVFMGFFGISLALKFAENAYTVDYNGQSKTGVNTWFKPFKPSRCIKASFQIAENRLNFPTSMSHPLQIIFIH